MSEAHGRPAEEKRKTSARTPRERRCSVGELTRRTFIE